jgi:hypothetical protein
METLMRELAQNQTTLLQNILDSAASCQTHQISPFDGTGKSELLWAGTAKSEWL